MKTPVSRHRRSFLDVFCAFFFFCFLRHCLCFYLYIFLLFFFPPYCSTLVLAQVDERALRNIMEMGFNRDAARQALMDNNNNLEAALNSLLTGSSGGRAGPLAAESHKPPPRGAHTHTVVALNPTSEPLPTHTHTNTPSAAASSHRWRLVVWIL